MSCLEWVILILVLGLVSMMEVCIISICIGKVLDEKLKVKAKIELAIFDKEMKMLKEVLNDCANMFMSMTKGDVKMTEPGINYCGYGNRDVVKPIKVKKKVEEEEKDPFDIDLNDYSKYII